MKRMKWLDEKKEEIIGMYCEKSYTFSGLSRLFNVSRRTLRSRFNEWGVKKSDYNNRMRIFIPEDDLVKLYKSGVTQGEIALLYNTSSASIRCRLRRLGILRDDPTGSKFRYKKLPKNKVINLYKKGFSTVELSRIFNVSASVIYNRLVKWDIPRRSFSECNVVRYERGVVINKNSYYGKGFYYNTPKQGRKWMRSSWEVKVADYLTELIIDWYYEYKFLVFKNNVRYLPDFYLPKENKYIEVKGRKTKKTMWKYELASKVYNVELWDKQKLIELGII